MFDFLVEIVRSDDGTRSVERFDTASDFLAARESKGRLALSFHFGDEVARVQYGDADVPLDDIGTVSDLYYWMCSDECEWFD